jgi:hypothetical protein
MPEAAAYFQPATQDGACPHMPMRTLYFSVLIYQAAAMPRCQNSLPAGEILRLFIRLPFDA